MISMILYMTLLAGVLLLIEHFYERQSWPKVPFWILRAVCANAVQILIIITLGTFFDNFIQEHSLLLFEGSSWLKILAAYLSITFVYYWWHRLRHVGIFWDLFHQIHHSPKRLELLTSFYKHPLEISANTLLSSSIIYGCFALNQTEGSIVIAITAIAEMFYHLNIKTPHWIGYIIQRPESHTIHHQSGFHTKNFSDIPLWDMLFGTFHNPIEAAAQCGFTENKEMQISSMLLGQNILRGSK